MIASISQWIGWLAGAWLVSIGIFMAVAPRRAFERAGRNGRVELHPFQRDGSTRNRRRRNRRGRTDFEASNRGFNGRLVPRGLRTRSEWATETLACGIFPILGASNLGSGRPSARSSYCGRWRRPCLDACLKIGCFKRAVLKLTWRRHQATTRRDADLQPCVRYTGQRGSPPALG